MRLPFICWASQLPTSSPLAVLFDCTRVTIFAFMLMELSMTTTFTPCAAAASTAGTRPSGSRGLRTRRFTPLVTMSSTSAICLFMSLRASAEAITLQPSSVAWALAAFSWATKYGAARVYIEMPTTQSLACALPAAATSMAASSSRLHSVVLIGASSSESERSPPRHARRCGGVDGERL